MKMTINFNSQIVISVQANATQSRYAVAKTMTKLQNSVGVQASQLNHKTTIKPEASQL